MTNIIGKILAVLGKRSSLENPSVPLTDDSAIDILGGSVSSAGISINRENALTYAAVWRAVDMISSDIGKLPLHIYRRTDRGKERDPQHPAYQLLRYKPNSEMTANIMRKTMQAHVLLTGNAYAYIFRRMDGTPVELVPLNPESTYPVRENGRLWYITTLSNQSMRRLNPSNVIHIRGLGFDGLQGYSVITKAAESIGFGLALRKYGSVFFKNNARPNVILEHPNTLSPQAADRLKRSWESLYSGLDNAHKTAILEEGMKAHILSINAEDAQLLQSRQFEIREIANWFGVPPHKLGDDSRTAYNSLEQENQSYLDQALDPWLVTWELELRDKLLTEEQKLLDKYVVEFLREALLRADLKTQAMYYRMALGGAPWMTIDEVRAKTNLNELPGSIGKQLILPLNMQQTAEQKALRQLFEATLRRMIKRIAIQANKASKEYSRFKEFSGQFVDENKAIVREALDPICQLAHARTDDIVNAFFELITQPIKQIRADTLGVVPEMFEDIERTLPEFLAKNIFTTEQK